MRSSRRSWSVLSPVVVTWATLLAFVVSAMPACAKVYLNQWAVRVDGGPAVADSLAAEYGFSNLGQVRFSLLTLTYKPFIRTMVGQESIRWPMLNIIWQRPTSPFAMGGPDPV